MTDVVAIAKDRRARLEAEIARLDDFIQFAEVLVRHGQGLDGRPVREAEPGAPITLLSELDSASIAPRKPTPPRAPGLFNNGATGREEKKAADDAEATRSGSDGESDDASDPFHFEGGAPKDEELVLSGPDSGEDTVADARIGQCLRQRRWMTGMTKKQLAEHLGVDVETIRRYEEGEAHVTTARLWHIAAALGVPLSFFFEEGQERPEDAGNTDRTEATAAAPAAEPAARIA